MKRVFAVLGVVGWLCVVALAAVLWVQSNQSEELAGQLRNAEQSLEANSAALEDQSATARDLENKLSQVTAVLQQTTSKLDAMVAQAAKTQGTRETMTASVAWPAKEFPEPRQAALTDPQGKSVAVTHFEKLPGAKSEVLATNVHFSDLYGRRLVFRQSSGPPLAFDVDELHPAVLARLNINSESAKKAQEAWDEQKRKEAEAARKQFIARIAAEQKQREAEQKLRAEQARLAEEQRQARAGEALLFQQAENDRVRAEAALRSADAAILEALKPEYYYPPYYHFPVVVVPHHGKHPHHPVATPPPAQPQGSGNNFFLPAPDPFFIPRTPPVNPHVQHLQTNSFFIRP